jgi:hypothetical protein
MRYYEPIYNSDRALRRYYEPIYNSDRAHAQLRTYL